MNARVASNAIWIAAYLAVMGLITLGMFAARDWALSSFDSSKNRAAWDEWREETQRLAEQPGPVLRRAAKSSEPPTVVLLRDYFAVCLAALLVLSSVLFATLAFMIRGVAGGPAFSVDLAVDDNVAEAASFGPQAGSLPHDEP